MSRKFGPSEFGPASGFGLGGKAAQKMAVESFSNIANVDISAAKPAILHFEELVKALKQEEAGLSVGELAKRLQWNPDMAANTFADAGKSGLVTFATEGNKTVVKLSGR